jgi:hypothetical protein
MPHQANADITCGRQIEHINRLESQQQWINQLNLSKREAIPIEYN